MPILLPTAMAEYQRPGDAISLHIKIPFVSDNSGEAMVRCNKSLVYLDEDTGSGRLYSFHANFAEWATSYCALADRAMECHP